MIKTLFKMAVLKCSDMEFLDLVCFTPEKMQMFLTGKLNTYPLDLKVSKPEIEELYNMYLAETMVDDCKALLIAIKPCLRKGHPLLRQIKKFTESQDFNDLYDILINKDEYLICLTHLTKLSNTLCSFYNRQLTKIDVKYLKSFAASVIDEIK